MSCLARCAVAAALRPAPAQALDKVSFGTNWVAEAEHGGFYQALADGTYQQYGLDVTIVPGGPNANNRILLTVGKIDFFLSANTLQSFDAVAHERADARGRGACSRRTRRFCIAHPDPGIDKFKDLKKLTLFVSKEGMASYFQWLQADYGFQGQPESSPTPSIRSRSWPTSTARCRAMSRPSLTPSRSRRGFKPKIFLLADYGFSAYSTLIETRRDLVENKPDLVQRFVDASIIGWYNYIYGDNAPANAMIKQQNPEMTDELLAYSVAKMKEYGIVDSGDRIDARHRRHDRCADEGFLRQDGARGRRQAGLDYRKSYTLRFVDKKVGLDLRPKHQRSTSPEVGRDFGRLPWLRCAASARRFRNGTLALAGLDLARPQRRVRRPARAVGLRQIDRAAAHRGPERADQRHGRMAGRAGAAAAAELGSALCSRSRR